MNDSRDRGDESGSELWTSTAQASSWEAQCLEELDRELEPNLDERLPQEKQFASEKLWYSFQNCASAVTTLYKGVCLCFVKKGSFIPCRFVRLVN